MSSDRRRVLCYTDASIRPNEVGEYGIFLGGVIVQGNGEREFRFSTGIPMDALTIAGRPTTNTNDAEMMAVMEGALFCRRLGFRNVQFIHDSESANRMIRGLARLRRLESSFLVCGINDLIQEAGINAEFTVIPREQNRIADVMASARSKSQLSYIPHDFLGAYAAQIPVLDYVRGELRIDVERSFSEKDRPKYLGDNRLALYKGTILATERATGEDFMLAAGMLTLAGRRRKDLTTAHGNWPYGRSGLTLHRAAQQWVAERCLENGFDACYLAPGVQLDRPRVVVHRQSLAVQSSPEAGAHPSLVAA